jgi:4-amino-4-deoxy-L-arabinose transferase-like glycosyltransferase
VILSALALLPGLGSSGRLTYHEAFVAQGAGEILHSGAWACPTIGGLPWLEKPPLPWWLIAVVASCAGGVTEAIARFPSALAAMGLVLGVAVLATRHFGPQIGLLAGAIQSTTAWTVMRGRLAEADILLTCMITWTIVAFDRVQNERIAQPGTVPADRVVPRWQWARWAFFALGGATALVKGIGFGAVLILTVTAGTLLWQRDAITLRRLRFPAGWILAAIVALAWPCLMLARYGTAVLTLWSVHVTDRLVGHRGPGAFASEPWWEFVPAILVQALPWTPLAFLGAWHSLGRAFSHRGGIGSPHGHSARVLVAPEVTTGDRLLWVWAAAPLSLLALATVKNAHYAISAQVPWSIWAALGLARLGERLRCRRSHRTNLLRVIQAGFIILAVTYGLGFWLLGPWFDRRGVEWAFYESAGRQCPSGMSLALLYDDWDRDPYDSSFGPVPHDLAVRLFYLNHPACWHMDAKSLLSGEHLAGGSCHGPHDSRTEAISVRGSASTGVTASPFAVIGRDRDLEALQQIGDVKVVARGPCSRRDRSYSLFHVIPGLIAPGISDRTAARTKY